MRHFFEIKVTAISLKEKEITKARSYSLNLLPDDVVTVMDFLDHWQFGSALDKEKWQFAGVQLSRDSWKTYEDMNVSQARTFRTDIREFHQCVFIFEEDSIPMHQLEESFAPKPKKGKSNYRVNFL